MNEDSVKSGALAPLKLEEATASGPPGENPGGIQSGDAAEQAFRLAKAGKAAGTRITLLDTEAALLYEMSAESEEGADGRTGQTELPDTAVTD